MDSKSLSLKVNLSFFFYIFYLIRLFLEYLGNLILDIKRKKIKLTYTRFGFELDFVISF